ncbi:MAG: hypothetical protein ABJP25_20950 [Sneathiella sp.]
MTTNNSKARVRPNNDNPCEQMGTAVTQQEYLENLIAAGTV